MNCRLSSGVSPGSSKFSDSVPSDQLLCLPEPLMPSKGFSCSRQTKSWREAMSFIFSIMTRFWSMASLTSP